MKLVELLARELAEWPSGGGYAEQDKDREVRFSEYANGDFFASVLADEDKDISCADGIPYAGRVTRAQWQAERDKQNGGEWKRHRGMKQPVSDGVMVEVKLRCGDIQQADAKEFIWPYGFCDIDANIMQYRIISQPQAEEVVAVTKLIHPSAFGAISDELIEAKTDQIDGPIKWRDTIIHCQAIIEDCEREIERNVQLLDAEGLMMQKDSKKAMQHYAPDVDPTDWRNWKAGDTLECTHSNYNSLYVAGRTYKVQEVTDDYASVYDECGGHSTCNIEDGDDENLTFIRRP